MNAQAFRCWLSCATLIVAVGALPAEAPVPRVAVGQPLEREVADYEEFVGRCDAASRVDLRARVTGYLLKVNFKEGAEVKQGDVLFEIDPRPYEALLNQALSQVAVAEASLKLAKTTFDRDQLIRAKSPDAISQRQLDEDQAALEEATAKLKAALAGVEVHKLNLSFTKVSAPFTGRIGRRSVDPGNLVNADATILGTVVSRDPMHVYFDVDERTMLRLRKALTEDRNKAEAAVALALADDKDFPRLGKIDFADNQVDPATGTLRLRAVFANADGVLLPGMFCRVRVTTGAPKKTLLIPEQAVRDDQGVKYLLVVNEKNVVEYRRVEVGRVLDSRRVIRTGLKAGEWVVLGKVDGLRPGVKVEPRKTEVPEEAPR